jgi:cyclic pyranopterin monophosphate synthase
MTARAVLEHRKEQAVTNEQAPTHQLGNGDVPGDQLTHVDVGGNAQIDVSAKQSTRRTTTATGRLETTVEVPGLLARSGMPKGDALGAARIAGIMGAKKTSDLIPLCHPIALSSVAVDLALSGSHIEISSTATTVGNTEVEMEALTAVAGLALHDMIKAVDPSAVLDCVRVEHKAGGKSGIGQRGAE